MGGHGGASLRKKAGRVGEPPYREAPSQVGAIGRICAAQVGSCGEGKLPQVVVGQGVEKFVKIRAGWVIACAGARAPDDKALWEKRLRGAIFVVLGARGNEKMLEFEGVWSRTGSAMGAVLRGTWSSGHLRKVGVSRRPGKRGKPEVAEQRGGFGARARKESRVAVASKGCCS